MRMQRQCQISAIGELAPFNIKAKQRQQWFWCQLRTAWLQIQTQIQIHIKYKYKDKIFTSQRVLSFPIQMLMDVIDTDRCVSERSSIAFPTRKLWNWSGWPRSEIWGVYQDEVETEQSLLFWRKCGCQSSQVQVQGCNRCFEKYKFNWIWIRGWSRATDQNFAEMLLCNWCMP